MPPGLEHGPLGVQEAYDALDGFGSQYGRVRLLLLLHVAVPQSFRADLLNLLKRNFLADEAGTDMTVDSDVLLSPLVQPGAAGYYRIDPEVRRHALALLDAAYRHRPVRRTVDVARLLLAYADSLERQSGLTLDPLLAEYLTVQRWVAVSFIEPRSAAEAFARALDGATRPGTSEVALRLGSITAALSVPLAGQGPLLAYAGAVEALARGDVDASRRLLSWMRDGELRVGGVTLRPPSGFEHASRARPTGHGDMRRALITVGVPEQSSVVSGRESDLARLSESLLTPLPDRTRGPVIAIVGPAGIGKWSLANAVAHEPSIREFYSDGIVWLGEDGMGYPRAAFREYARAVALRDAREAGVDDAAVIDANAKRLIDGLLDDGDFVKAGALEPFFSQRRVLFIGEQRSASDIFPMLRSELPPSCAFIYLSGFDPTGVDAIQLPPLDDAYAHAAFAERLAGRGHAHLRKQLIDFTRGIPLLVRLVRGALLRRGAGSPQEELVGQLGDFNPTSVEEQVGQVLTALWGSLTPQEQATLRQTTQLPDNRTRFLRVELEHLGIARADEFVDLLYACELADVLGDTIRFNPMVRMSLDSLLRNMPPEAAREDWSGQYDVFISASHDDRRVVEPLMNALRAAGLRAVRAERAMEAPEEFVPPIEGAIRHASVFIPILSRAVFPQSASFVSAEWRIAIDEARRRPAPFILPIAIDDLEAGDPDVPEAFRAVRWHRAPGGRITPDLIEAIRSRVRESPGTEEPDTRPVEIVDSLRGPHTTIASAVTAASLGARIVVRPGTYVGPVVLDKPLDIVGEGDSSQIVIEATGATTVTFRSTAGGIRNVTLRQRGGGDHSAVEIDSGRVTVDHCVVESAGAAGILVHGEGVEADIRENRIHHCSATGIILAAGARGQLEGNDVSDNGVFGVLVQSAALVELRRNRLHHNEHGGVQIDGGSGSLLDNDIFENRAEGVLVANEGAPLLERNRIHGNGKAGVYVYDRGAPVVRDNLIMDNGNSGIAIRTGGNPVAERNKVNGNNGKGVWCDDQAAGVIEDNDLTGNKFGAFWKSVDSTTRYGDNLE